MKTEPSRRAWKLCVERAASLLGDIPQTYALRGKGESHVLCLLLSFKRLNPNIIQTVPARCRLQITRDFKRK